MAAVALLSVLVAVNAQRPSVGYVGRVQQSSTVTGAVEFEWSNIEIHTSYATPRLIFLFYAKLLLFFHN